MWKKFSHLCNLSLVCNDHTDSSGYLSLKSFRAGSPTDRNNQVTTFFSAASSGITPISAFTLGCRSSTVLVSSSIDIECLAITATANRSIYRSHSIAGGLSACGQNSGNPGSNEGIASFCEDVSVFDEFDARSAMLKVKIAKQEKMESFKNELRTKLHTKATANDCS